MLRSSLQACTRLVARPIFPSSQNILPSSSQPFSSSSCLLHEKEPEGSQKEPEAAACGRTKAEEMRRRKTPIGKLEEQPNVHPAQEKVKLAARCR